MQKILNEKDEYEYGFKLGEIHDFLWQFGLIDIEFNLADYLRKKKIIDKKGKVIDSVSGFMNMTETVERGLYEKTIDEYIFVTADSARKLVRELVISEMSKE